MLNHYLDKQFKKLNNAVSLSEESKDKMRNVIFNTPTKQKKHYFPKVLSALMTLSVIGLGYVFISSLFSESNHTANGSSIAENLTTIELTPHEEVAYQNFKKDLDLEHLRGLEPMSIAKLYLRAGFEEEFEVEYALYTDRENYIQWSLEEHLNMSKYDSPYKYNTINIFNGLIKGEFIQLSDYEGVINFTLDGEPMSFGMLQNEDGIWQVRYMPLQ